MKRVIIFEGIASTGKTTLENKVNENLSSSIIIDESETLMPLIDNRNPDLALSHLSEILNRIEQLSEEVIVIDRFHFTHTFRTNSSLATFKSIENKLKEISKPLVVFLSIQENLIRSRIQESIERRGESWRRGKRGSINEKVNYYTNQQRQLDRLAKKTALPIIHIDTSANDWEAYTSEILKNIERMRRPVGSDKM